MKRHPVTVLKFGSSVLQKPEDAQLVHQEIERELDRGFRVLVVVSAFKGVTDSLIEQARTLSHKPDFKTFAAFLATGERQAAGLVTIDLKSRGIAAHLLEPEEAGLRTTSHYLNADPVDFDIDHVRTLMCEYRALVMPGFFGLNENREACLLGRGGTDLAAIFAARQLAANSCRLIKDVEGIYTNRGARAAARALYARISWDDCLALDSGVVQSKALIFAREKNVEFTVCPPGGANGTSVGSKPSQFAA